MRERRLLMLGIRRRGARYRPNPTCDNLYRVMRRSDLPAFEVITSESTTDRTSTGHVAIHCERHQGALRSVGSHRCSRCSSHKAPVAKATMSAAITRHVAPTAT